MRGKRFKPVSALASEGIASAARLILALILVCTLSLLIAHRSPLYAQSAPPAKVAKSIERIFGPGVRVDTLKVDTVSVLRVSTAGTLLGFVRVRNVKGKDQPITYLVAIDPQDALKDVDVLVYREPYGGEVAYEPWRKQFRGKKTGEPLIVGKDIRNISGATISSHSVTLGVRQTLADLSSWHAAGKIK